VDEAKTITVSELADHVGGSVSGDGSLKIRGLASLEAARPGEITYVEDEKLFAVANNSEASCVIAPENVNLESPAVLHVKQPKLAFALIAKLLHPAIHREPSIDPTAVIAKSADIALTAFIGPHVAIEDGARIGAGTRVEAGSRCDGEREGDAPPGPGIGRPRRAIGASRLRASYQSPSCAAAARRRFDQ